jgi:hypothetical protein
MGRDLFSGKKMAGAGSFLPGALLVIQLTPRWGMLRARTDSTPDPASP